MNLKINKKMKLRNISLKKINFEEFLQNSLKIPVQTMEEPVDLKKKKK
jgi:hypothetical protein